MTTQPQNTVGQGSCKPKTPVIPENSIVDLNLGEFTLLLTVNCQSLKNEKKSSVFFI